MKKNEKQKEESHFLDAYIEVCIRASGFGSAFFILSFNLLQMETNPSEI